ncbi:unnamed protein product [Ectocarpus sp. 12 AP-2014]
MTSAEADNYHHPHPAEIDPTINFIEATFGSTQPADRTTPTDNPQINTETAVIQPHGDVQLTKGAVLAVSHGVRGESLGFAVIAVPALPEETQNHSKTERSSTANFNARRRSRIQTRTVSYLCYVIVPSLTGVSRSLRPSGWRNSLQGLNGCRQMSCRKKGTPRRWWYHPTRNLTYMYNQVG